MIELLKLKIKYETIKPYTIEFKQGVNIIVGDNGTGKSTMLDMINRHKAFGKDTLGIKVSGKNNNSMFFDSEKDSPRTKQNDPGDLYAITDRFKSHGEALFPIIDHCKTMENMIILLDEPDSGISIKNQKKLVESFNKAVKNNCQLIIVTHSYVLIKAYEDIFDMDIKKWLKSNDYLKGI